MKSDGNGSLRKPVIAIAALCALEAVGYGFMIAAGIAFAMEGNVAILACIPLAAIANTAVGTQIQRMSDELWNARIESRMRAGIR